MSEGVESGGGREERKRRYVGGRYLIVFGYRYGVMSRASSFIHFSTKPQSLGKSLAESLTES